MLLLVTIFVNISKYIQESEVLNFQGLERVIKNDGNATLETRDKRDNNSLDQNGKCRSIFFLQRELHFFGWLFQVISLTPVDWIVAETQVTIGTTFWMKKMFARWYFSYSHFQMNFLHVADFDWNFLQLRGSVYTNFVTVNYYTRRQLMSQEIQHKVAGKLPSAFSLSKKM